MLGCRPLICTCSLRTGTRQCTKTFKMSAAAWSTEANKQTGKERQSCNHLEQLYQCVDTSEEVSGMFLSWAFFINRKFSSLILFCQDMILHGQSAKNRILQFSYPDFKSTWAKTSLLIVNPKIKHTKSNNHWACGIKYGISFLKIIKLVEITQHKQDILRTIFYLLHL